MRSFIRSAAQFVMLSVGLGLVVEYNTGNVWGRIIGLVLIVGALDWRYEHEHPN